jgi:catechol 2,3-dioxygenase-like lactoylglutathione lyase family enzyme
MNMFFRSGCLALVLAAAPAALAQNEPASGLAPAFAAQGAFAAFVVTDLAASVSWYESNLGLHEIKRGRSPRVSAETVVLGGRNIFIELIHFDDRTLAKRKIDDTAPVAGPVKTGMILSRADFEAVAGYFRARGGAELGIFEDKEMAVRSFIIKDNDGNLLQFFAPMK